MIQPAALPPGSDNFPRTLVDTRIEASALQSGMKANDSFLRTLVDTRTEAWFWCAEDRYLRLSRSLLVFSHTMSSTRRQPHLARQWRPASKPRKLPHHLRSRERYVLGRISNQLKVRIQLEVRCRQRRTASRLRKPPHNLQLREKYVLMPTISWK